MDVKTCEIEGAFILKPRVYGDDRGAFFETYRKDVFAEIGIHEDFKQDNRSISQQDVLRGLHYQIAAPQGHLVTLTHGKVFDVGLDLRKNSPTFGRITCQELTADPPVQLYLPPGVAHGFCVLSERAEIWYRCTGFYDPSSEGGVLWSDPDLDIPWPVKHPIISDRDAAYPLFTQIGVDRLPQIPD